MSLGNNLCYITPLRNVIQQSVETRRGCIKINLCFGCSNNTLRSETFAGRNLRGFAVFWPFRETFFPRNFSKRLKKNGSSTKVYSCKIYLDGLSAKVFSCEMQKFRGFFNPRKFLLAKVSDLKVGTLLVLCPCCCTCFIL